MPNAYGTTIGAVVPGRRVRHPLRPIATFWNSLPCDGCHTERSGGATPPMVQSTKLDSRPVKRSIAASMDGDASKHVERRTTEGLVSGRTIAMTRRELIERVCAELPEGGPPPRQVA